jgi:CubicO group peptidase (beta-lactamase class C family)
MATFPLFKSCFAVLMTIACSSASSGQTAEAETHIKSIMHQFDVVGLAVVVVKHNRVIYTNSFGLKNIESNSPLANNDLFRIASISKSFSATSVMQLMEAGKISLEDDVSDLAGFKIRNPKYPDKVITLKMIMSHTSSLNDSQGYFSFDVINPAKNPSWASCYSDYAPGAGYRYCNLNYNLVGAIIERKSGERFDLYVKHHILDRLKLYGGYNVDSLDKSRFATLYEYDSATKRFTSDSMAYVSRSEQIKNYAMGYSTPLFSPTGGMKISAPDLARYMMMHMNKGGYKGVRIMKKKSSILMQTKISEQEGYGLAIMNLDNLIPGKVMTGHTGSAYGLFSAMFFQPKEKFGMVVITNGCNPVYTNDINTVLRTTINSLYEDFIK